MPTSRIKQAARLLGVSPDTLCRWADRGRVETATDASGRMAVDGKALARLARDLTELADPGEAKVVVSQAALARLRQVARRQA
jgi:predicted site-specific integrase-resolvase